MIRTMIAEPVLPGSREKFIELFSKAVR